MLRQVVVKAAGKTFKSWLVVAQNVMTLLLCQFQAHPSWGRAGLVQASITFSNRPFYSCVLSYLAMNASEAGGDIVLIQTSQLFSCKCKLVSIRTT